MTKVPLFKSPAHRYTIDGIPTPAVTQVIRGAGLAPPIHVPEHILNAKGAIGTEFHLEISTIAKMIMDFSRADSEERALAIIERKAESESTWRTRAAIKFLCQIQARVIAVEQKHEKQLPSAFFFVTLKCQQINFPTQNPHLCL